LLSIDVLQASVDALTDDLSALKQRRRWSR